MNESSITGSSKRNTTTTNKLKPPSINFDLVWELALFDLTIEYKKSRFSFFWVIFTPLFQVIIWVFLQLSGVLKPGVTEVPYPIYVLISISLWMFFKGAYEISSNILTRKGHLLLSNRINGLTLVFSTIVSVVFKLSITLFACLLFYLLYSKAFNLGILFLPFALIPILAAGIGVGLFWSVFRIVAIDATRVFDRLVDLLMFITPVVYAKQIGGAFFESIMEINPLTYLIELPRSLIFGTVLDLNIFFWAALVGSVLLALSGGAFFLSRYSHVLEKLTK